MPLQAQFGPGVVEQAEPRPENLPGSRLGVHPAELQLAEQHQLLARQLAEVPSQEVSKELQSPPMRAGSELTLIAPAG